MLLVVFFALPIKPTCVLHPKQFNYLECVFSTVNIGNWCRYIEAIHLKGTSFKCPEFDYFTADKVYLFGHDKAFV